MSVVYTTLLSLVPLLAVSCSRLKAFGVHCRFKPPLNDFVEAIGPKGPELVANIIECVDNVNTGLLGSVGLLLFICTGGLAHPQGRGRLACSWACVS